MYDTFHPWPVLVPGMARVYQKARPSVGAGRGAGVTLSGVLYFRFNPSSGAISMMEERVSLLVDLSDWVSFFFLCFFGV